MAQTLTFLFLLLSAPLLSAFTHKKHSFLSSVHSNELIQIPLKRHETKNQIFDFLMKKESENRSMTIDTEAKSLSFPLRNYRNTQFIGEIAIGEKSNLFRVIFDTGSANIWINSNKCHSEGCNSHKKYDGSNHPHYAQSNKTLNVEFGSGELEGYFSSDTMFISSLSVQNQTFVEISKEVGEVFSKVKFDGIVGLAFKTMSAQNSTPLFNNIMEGHLLKNGVFGFFLSKEGNGELDSRMFLGGIDEEIIEGGINYYEVLEEYYWSIEMESIKINGVDSGLCKNCKAVIDTGTSLITGPTNHISELLALLNIEKSCQNLSELPQISFVFKGKDYTIEPEDYVLYREKDGLCIGLFMPMDIPEPRGPAWVLGDLFLMKYVSVFDMEKKRIGLAKARRKH